LTRRLGITLADQAISSASNFLVVLAVARVSGVSGFGAFTLAFLAYQLALGSLRAGAGDVLLIRSAEVARSRDADARQALGFVLAAAAPAAAITCAVGALVGDELGGSLLAIGIVLIPTLLEDCYRYVLFAASRPRSAVVIDSVWLIAQLGGFALASQGALPNDPSALILVWGAGATIACACGGVLAGFPPALGALAWIRAAPHRVGGLMADFMLLTGTSYLGFALVPLVASLSTVAALRGALLLFNPLAAFLTSVRVVALPALTRGLVDGKARYRSVSIRLSAGLALVTVVYSAVVLAIPDGVGKQILGRSWLAASAILLPVSVAYLARAISYPATEALRALGDARRLIATRAACAAAIVFSLVVGAAVSGATGAAVGLAGVYWATAAFWQLSLRGSLARREGSVPLPSHALTADEETEEELIALDGDNLP
jgi:O-antigen/teichoic acid export membrane protein